MKLYANINCFSARVLVLLLMGFSALLPRGEEPLSFLSIWFLWMMVLDASMRGPAQQQVSWPVPSKIHRPLRRVAN